MSTSYGVVERWFICGEQAITINLPARNSRFLSKSSCLLVWINFASSSGVLSTSSYLRRYSTPYNTTKAILIHHQQIFFIRCLYGHNGKTRKSLADQRKNQVTHDGCPQNNKERLARDCQAPAYRSLAFFFVSKLGPSSSGKLYETSASLIA